MTRPTCDMSADCREDVTYIDSSGWVYCTPHGLTRQATYRCRKMRPHELNRITKGLPLKRY